MVERNRAIGGPGGTGGTGGVATGGGGLRSGGGSTLTVINTTVAYNQAQGGEGGGAGKKGADGWGGGLIDYLATLTLKGVIVTQNVALGGGPDGKGLGGGVYVYEGGTYSADSTTVIEKNHAITSNDNIWP
jgi:hypothetical protein